MHYIHKKGTVVKPTEQGTKISFPWTGVFAALRGLHRVQGGGAPAFRSHRRRFLPAAPAMLAAVLALAVLAAPAFASGPPQVRPELKEEVVYATRAHLVVEMEPGGLEVEWHAEYATSEKELEEGKGMPAGGETIPFPEKGQTLYSRGIGTEEFIIGNGFGGESHAANAAFHHLEPSTPYYVRVVAKNADGEATRTFIFKTLPVGKPEIAALEPALERTTFRNSEISPTSAAFTAQIDSNGAPTEYHFEYTTEPGNTVSWKTFTSDGEGSVSVAEDFAEPKAKLTGLTPETTYYVRVKAKNREGVTEQDKHSGPGSSELESFTTPTAKPVVGRPEARNVTGLSAHLTASLEPHRSKTEWRFETAESEIGPWSVVSGGVGTVSQAQAEALPEDTEAAGIAASLTDLSPATVYYVRLFAKNAAGEGEYCVYGGGESCEPVSVETRGLGSFETAGPPKPTVFGTHALHGEALRVLGVVNPTCVPRSSNFPRASSATTPRCRPAPTRSSSTRAENTEA